MYAPPPWFAAIATLSMLITYVFIVTSGAAGLWLQAPHDWRAQVVVLLPGLVILAGHTLAFGHSRYHLPLIPILGIYAAALVTSPVPLTAWARRARTLGAAVSVMPFGGSPAGCGVGLLLRGSVNELGKVDGFIGCGDAAAYGSVRIGVG